MFQFLSILNKQMDVPFINCQPKGKLFTLKFLCECRLSRTGKSHHEMERSHGDFSRFFQYEPPKHYRAWVREKEKLPDGKRGIVR